MRNQYTLPYGQQRTTASLYKTLYEEHLDQYYDALHASYEEYQEVYALRFSLNLPYGMNPNEPYMDYDYGRYRLLEDAQLKNFLKLCRYEIESIHDCLDSIKTSLRYIWGKETKENNQVRYHLIFMLNKKSFNKLGYDTNSQSLYSKIKRSWANVLELSINEVGRYVYIPTKPSHHLHVEYEASSWPLLERAKYICRMAAKEATKSYSAMNAFGARSLEMSRY